MVIITKGGKESFFSVLFIKIKKNRCCCVFTLFTLSYHQEHLQQSSPSSSSTPDHVKKDSRSWSNADKAGNTIDRREFHVPCHHSLLSPTKNAQNMIIIIPDTASPINLPSYPKERRGSLSRGVLENSLTQKPSYHPPFFNVTKIKWFTFLPDSRLFSRIRRMVVAF